MFRIRMMHASGKIPGGTNESCREGYTKGLICNGASETASNYGGGRWRTNFGGENFQPRSHGREASGWNIMRRVNPVIQLPF